MKFEYDKNKSLINKDKHGIDFEEAKKLWHADNIILNAKYLDEPRQLIIGRINEKYYTCIFTFRNNKIRIISCRISRKEERRIYDEN
ncbi:MAG: BrnT family toxin [Candidatus Margulisbacteria bacterium]|nr:BrnT family toxin [Candidatus Margulisiibacteriota bacterium]